MGPPAREPTRWHDGSGRRLRSCRGFGAVASDPAVLGVSARAGAVPTYVDDVRGTCTLQSDYRYGFLRSMPQHAAAMDLKTGKIWQDS